MKRLANTLLKVSTVVIVPVVPCLAADNAGACVTYQTDSNQIVRLANKCNQAIVVNYRVDKPGKAVSCPRIGENYLGPGRTGDGIYNTSEGRQTVHGAARFAAAPPRNQTGDHRCC